MQFTELFDIFCGWRRWFLNALKKKKKTVENNNKKKKKESSVLVSPVKIYMYEVLYMLKWWFIFELYLVFFFAFKLAAVALTPPGIKR